MLTKEFNLSEQELQHYIQLEESIKHWSTQHTRAVIQADRLLGAVNNMYEARMQMVNTALKAKGFDPAHVHQVNVDDSGVVKVTYDEHVPNPAADPAEGSAVSPTAKPVAP